MEDVAVAWKEVQESFARLKYQMSKLDPDAAYVALHAKALYADVHNLTEKIRGSTSRSST